MLALTRFSLLSWWNFERAKGSMEGTPSHVGVNINLQSARINLSELAFMSFTPKNREERKKRGRGWNRSEDPEGDIKKHRRVYLIKFSSAESKRKWEKEKMMVKKCDEKRSVDFIVRKISEDLQSEIII